MKMKVVNMSFLLLLLLFSATSALQSASATISTNTAFRALAIEHVAYTSKEPVTNTSAAVDVMNKNLDILSSKIFETIEKDPFGIDLVLFPEMALTSLTFHFDVMAHYLMKIPAIGWNGMLNKNSDTKNNCTAHLNTKEPEQMVILRRLSSLAYSSGVYLVVNWGNRYPNPKNISDMLQFNTDIVFSPTGELIAMYEKIHTFNCTEFTSVPLLKRNVWFDLVPKHDPLAVVKVGLAVCFDASYPDPIIPLMQEQGITTFVLSHWWPGQFATMSAQMFFQAISQTYGINIIAAGSVWEKIYPFASGSIITSQGNVLSSFYRTGQKDVVLWNDGLLIANIPKLKIDQTFAKALPKPILPPPTSTKPPLPMCHAKHIIGNVKPGQSVVANVTCGKMTCSVKALASATQTTNPNSQDLVWTLFLSYGYYFKPDGDHIFYNEQFCTLYQCNSKKADNNSLAPCIGLISQQTTEVTDDHGGTSFEFVEITANFYEDAVILPMSANGNGTVEVGSGLRDSIYIFNAETKQPLKAPVVRGENVSTSILFKLNGGGGGGGGGQKSPAGASSISKTRINFSVMGRNYNRDYKYVNVTQKH